MSGSFIVVEGIDGSGKSTVCGKVADVLSGHGIDVVLTAEPTYERVGALIREGSAGNVSQRTEALLFVADRNDHTERIESWVSEGKVVLCDRYFASTVAYQSSGLDGDRIDREWLIDINRQFIRKPDATILLDVDPSVSLDRVGVRGEAVSKFERPDFLKQVRREYLNLAEEYGFEIVDASADADKVFQDVLAIVEEII